MNMVQKIKNEIRTLVLLTSYFVLWIGALVTLKKLILAEYNIQFQGWSMVFIGALILSKVVAILEHVSLGSWVNRQPAIVDVILRTFLYTLGVFVVLVLEKGLEGRHEHGGFMSSVVFGFKHAEIYHVLANTICVSGALFVYNMLSVIKKHLGEGGLLRIFFSPVAKQ